MARVGIVGAGVAGLITAHTLQQCGYDVTIYDEHDEVGGVWSSSRRYPGVTTQSPKDTYAFSSFPMPSHYPEFPSGEQVQAYLEAFARQAGLERCLRLGERVIKTEQVVSGWEITVSSFPSRAECRHLGSQSSLTSSSLPLAPFPHPTSPTHPPTPRSPAQSSIRVKSPLSTSYEEKTSWCWDTEGQLAISLSKRRESRDRRLWSFKGRHGGSRGVLQGLCNTLISFSLDL